MPSIRPNVLRSLRRKVHRTQEEVALGAGITRAYLSKLETAPEKENPSDEVIVTLARVLGAKPAELYDLELENVEEETLHRAIRKMKLAEILAVHYNINPKLAGYLAEIEDESIRARIALDQLEQRAGRPPIYSRQRQEGE